MITADVPEDWLKNSKSFFERRLEKEEMEKSKKNSK